MSNTISPGRATNQLQDAKDDIKVLQREVNKMAEINAKAALVMDQMQTQIDYLAMALYEIQTGGEQYIDPVELDS